MLRELKVPVQGDIAGLESRIAVLERRVAELEGHTAPRTQEDVVPETHTE